MSEKPDAQEMNPAQRAEVLKFVERLGLDPTTIRKLTITPKKIIAVYTQPVLDSEDAA